MQVDYSVEIGPEEPALELPWQSEDGSIRYLDLKSNLDLIRDIPEAAACPDLAAFLVRINAPGFPLQSAKCDLWQTGEMTVEEEIFNARGKCASYVDLLFADESPRLSFEKHESLVKNLCILLKRTPEMPAAVEFVVRQCHYHSGVQDEDNANELRHSESIKRLDVAQEIVSGRTRKSDAGTDTRDDRTVAGGQASSAGFVVTAYVSGYDDDEEGARQRWAIALKLLQNALVQWASRRNLEVDAP